MQAKDDDTTNPIPNHKMEIFLLKTTPWILDRESGCAEVLQGILAEGAIALSVTLSGGALFAS